MITTTTKQLCNRQDIIDAVRAIIPAGHVTELRALKANTDGSKYLQTLSGYFDSPEKLADAAMTIRKAKGIYIIPNQVDPALIARAANKFAADKDTPATADTNVIRRRWLLIDADCERPAGISATEDEMDMAIARVSGIRKFLRSCNWPEPIMANSGNGAHLMYRIDLPADDGGLVNRCLAALAKRFTRDGVKVDTTVGNPARIWKLYGTLACKGDDTEDRPHRMAEITNLPATLDVVPTELLEQLASEVSEPDRPTTTSTTPPTGKAFDVAAFIERHNLEVAGPKDWPGHGRRWELKPSPMCEHHDGAAFVGEMASGAIVAGCRHQSCSWEWKDLRAKFEPRAEKQPAPTPSERRKARQSQYHLTDYGNAERLIARHGKVMRYCHPWKKWLVYDGMRWRRDDCESAKGLAKKTIRSMFARLDKIANKQQREDLFKWATKSESNKQINAMLSMAQSEDGVPIQPDELDVNPCLLNCPNGTLDLRTAELRPHDQANFITKLCPTPYDPDAPSFVWDRFLESVFVDQQLIDFVQRLFGYCLTGMTTEQVLPIFFGSGSNGKSTLINAFLRAMGNEYAVTIDRDLLIAKQQHPTGLTDLHGTRFAVASETDDGHRLNESLVKQLTGSDRIRARKCSQDFWEFESTHKIILSTNHKPDVKGTDHAIWRRMALVPFDRIFWDADKGETGPDHLRMDKTLPQRLEAEAPGILAWAVRGCIEWQTRGLDMPECVRVATREYRTDQDVIQRFIDECCIVTTQVSVKAATLYDAYRRWCEQEGDKPLTNTKFGLTLNEKGFKKRESHGIWRDGITTKSNQDGE